MQTILIVVPHTIRHRDEDAPAVSPVLKARSYRRSRAPVLGRATRADETLGLAIETPTSTASTIQVAPVAKIATGSRFCG
jgi:hypothetical protein